MAATTTTLARSLLVPSAPYNEERDQIRGFINRVARNLPQVVRDLFSQELYQQRTVLKLKRNSLSKGQLTENEMKLDKSDVFNNKNGMNC